MWPQCCGYRRGGVGAADLVDSAAASGKAETRPERGQARIRERATGGTR
eukprot:ctg_4933.g599